MVKDDLKRLDNFELAKPSRIPISVTARLVVRSNCLISLLARIAFVAVGVGLNSCLIGIN